MCLFGVIDVVILSIYFEMGIVVYLLRLYLARLTTAPAPCYREKPERMTSPIPSSFWEKR